MEPGTPRRTQTLDSVRRFVWYRTLGAVNEDLSAFHNRGIRTEPHASSLAVQSAIRAIKNTRALSGPNKEIALGRLASWKTVFNPK